MLNPSTQIKTAILSNKPDLVLHLVIGGLFPPGAFDAGLGALPGLQAAGAARIIDSPGELWEVPGR